MLCLIFVIVKFCFFWLVDFLFRVIFYFLLFILVFFVFCFVRFFFWDFCFVIGSSGFECVVEDDVYSFVFVSLIVVVVVVFWFFFVFGFLLFFLSFGGVFWKCLFCGVVVVFGDCGDWGIIGSVVVGLVVRGVDDCLVFIVGGISFYCVEWWWMLLFFFVVLMFVM